MTFLLKAFPPLLQSLIIGAHLSMRLSHSNILTTPIKHTVSYLVEPNQVNFIYVSQYHIVTNLPQRLRNQSAYNTLFLLSIYS